MSKTCKKCTTWECRKNYPEFDYNLWFAEHVDNDECEINHESSSGAMESSGGVKIFKRSVKKNGLIYSDYLGDGDTSSFSDVVNSEPYKDHGNVVPQKLDCVGHVQKRLGCRLRSLIEQDKGEKIISLSRKNKLIKKSMNSMQNYYESTIRNTKNDLYAMNGNIMTKLVPLY